MAHVRDRSLVRIGLVLGSLAWTACTARTTDDVDAMGSLDAAADALDAVAECHDLSNLYCGAPCRVPCSFLPTCSFSVVTRWVTTCCAPNDVTYADCICESGFAVCRPPTGSGPREAPMDWCTRTCSDARVPDAGADAASDLDARASIDVATDR